MRIFAIAIMVLIFVLPGQVDAQCISGCSPSFGPPIVYAPPLYNNIHFDGQTHTKQYVNVRTRSGGIIEVPVVNGILPRYAEVTYASGVVVRDFYYDTGVYWKNDGRMPSYSNNGHNNGHNRGSQIERKEAPQRAEEDRGYSRPTPAPTPKIERKDFPLDRGEDRTRMPKVISPKIEKKDSPGLEELRQENKFLGEKLNYLEDQVGKLKSIESQQWKDSPALDVLRGDIRILQEQIKETKDLPIIDRPLETR